MSRRGEFLNSSDSITSNLVSERRTDLPCNVAGGVSVRRRLTFVLLVTDARSGRQRDGRRCRLHRKLTVRAFKWDKMNWKMGNWGRTLLPNVHLSRRLLTRF
ncbi:hypothetical protein EVAR_102736_1 [Eumeta japonica]|uniref:Uncharacterized protein n=1 Tax=Eumeta variegata TaxID=151549 RepID=A0A4C1TIZ3_EUMVA|nr:hypothetical protein EVAR_102736_1 [Eumeta japonica]